VSGESVVVSSAPAPEGVIQGGEEKSAASTRRMVCASTSVPTALEMK
jgi:hypothetical protein